MSLVVSDAVSRVLGLALDGVTTRQQVIANNIANVDTPDFRATTVDFETSLRQAVEGGDIEDPASTPAIESSLSTTPVGANGNNVDLRHETLAAVQSQFQYQILTRAVNDRFTLVRDALGGA